VAAETLGEAAAGGGGREDIGRRTVVGESDGTTAEPGGCEPRDQSHTASYRYVSAAGAWLEPLTSTHTDRAIENADERVVDEQGATRVGLLRDEGVQHVLDASPRVCHRDCKPRLERTCGALVTRRWLAVALPAATFRRVGPGRGIRR
jgi:hypothetical protein